MVKSKSRKLTRRTRTRGSARTATQLPEIRASNGIVAEKGYANKANATGVLQSSEERIVEGNATSPMYVAPIHNKVEPYQVGIAGPSNEAIMKELQNRQNNMESAASKRPAEIANLHKELNTLTRAEQAVKLLDKAREQEANLHPNNAEDLRRHILRTASDLIGPSRKGGSRKNKHKNRKTHRKL
jgi:hypothetical protein